MATPDPRRSSATAPPASRRFDTRRVYTAAVLIPAIYAVIRYLPPFAFTLLLIAGASIALFELYRMAFEDRRQQWLIGLGLAATAAVIGRSHLNLSLADLLVAVTLAAVSGLLWSSVPLEHRFRDTAVALFGILYVGLPLSALVLTRALPSGEWFVLFAALVTWAGDTGAYYAGSLWGQRLLAPSLSPKKTVEGLLGGTALAVVTAGLAQGSFLPQVSVTHAAMLGILMTGAGVIGDLCESAIKRSVGVKDSGGILPGHGGMLDRLDSLLFTAPAFYYYVVVVCGLSPLP